MRLIVDHTSSYTYESPVKYGLQQIRLTPKETADQTAIDWKIEVEGGKHELSFQDHHRNQVNLISIEPGELSISIRCVGEVESTGSSGIVGKHIGLAPLWLFKRQTPLTKPGPLLRKLVASLSGNFTDDLEKVHALSDLIRSEVKYETGRTNAATTAEEAVAAGHGVCQDHAHIFLSATRLLGLSSRYVSGYLMMNDRIDQDATHAWAEVYLDKLGWVGFDVSNGYSPDERYIRVATGLDFSEASPISGMRYGAGREDMFVTLQVQQ